MECLDRPHHRQADPVCGPAANDGAVARRSSSTAACGSLSGIVLVEVEYRGTELCAQLADLEWFQQGDLAGRYRKGDQPVIGDSDDYLSPPPGDVATCRDPLIRWSLPPRRENISTDAEQSGERGNRPLHDPFSAPVPPIP